MLAFAYDSQYRPRPVLQSFSAYTPLLAELNANHLRTDKAADTIVLDGDTIDGRYLSLDDGLSWPELLTRYDVRQVEIPFVVLQRATAPRKFTLTRLQEVSIKFGEQLSLPTNIGPLWAEIEIDPTFTGSLASALFKPPTLVINTTLRNGQHRVNRIVPEMAKSGFILSPCITDCTSFADLTSDRPQPGLDGKAVTAFNIAPVDGSSMISSYKNQIRVRLYHLDYPKQDLENVSGYTHLVGLKEDLSHATLIGPGQLVYLRDAGSVLTTATKTTISLDPPKNSIRLRVGFGLYTRGGDQNLNGVTFFACALDAQQQVTPLWNRHIDPRVTSGDRGNQEASVDLGKLENQRILLGIMPDPGGTNETLCPYWTQMHFE